MHGSCLPEKGLRSLNIDLVAAVEYMSHGFCVIVILRSGGRCRGFRHNASSEWSWAPKHFGHSMQFWYRVISLFCGREGTAQVGSTSPCVLLHP